MDGDQGKDTPSKPTENINTKSAKPLGLSTRIALEILQRDVKRVLQEYEEEYKRNK